MSCSLQSTEAAGEATAKQQQLCGAVNNEVQCDKTSQIDGGGLRSPLDDADIFNTLFNKWGCDDATEAAAVGSLGDFLFADGVGNAAAGGAGMQRSATPLLGMGTPFKQQQQQLQQPSCTGAAAGASHQQQLKQPCMQPQQPAQVQFGMAGGLEAPVNAFGAAATQVHMQPGGLMVSAQSMAAMQMHQLMTQSAAAMSAGSDHQQQQQQGQCQPGQGALAPSAQQPCSQHSMGFGAAPEAMSAVPPAAAWPQLMMQQYLQQQQQQQQQLGQAPPFMGLGCGGPFSPMGGFGASGMFGPGAAAAAAAGLPALMNPCQAPFPGAAGMFLQTPPWQQQQQHSLASCAQQPAAIAAASQDQPASAPAAGAGCVAVLPHNVPGAAGGAGAPLERVDGATHAPAGSAPAQDGRSVAVQAATGAILPALQPPLPQELIAALGSMPGVHGAAGVPLPLQAAGAGVFPGSWPLHLMGLLRPPSLPVPSVMQLAMMMQAAAQAAVLPGGGGLQPTAMLVAALQSMAASDMQGLLGPWGPGMATWQQQQQQQVPQQVAPHTQNNGSCLGQYGQGHLMSHGTRGFGGQGHPKATMQPGSHVQGGSQMGGSHYVGSHMQTSTTGDYSGQAGDAGCMHRQSAAAAAATGAYGSSSQWVMLNEQQQQWPQRQQQQWHAASGADLEAVAAELAAVEAITPRHSRQHPQHKAIGKRGGRIADSRRSRANNRLRVKGRFVKRGTPGAAVAGFEPEAAEQQHTASDHDMSDGETADDPEQLELSHMLSGCSGAAAAAAAEPMMLEGWGGDMQPAAAAGAADAPAVQTAAGGDGSAGDKFAPVLLVSPGSAAHCWAEVVGLGTDDADAAWQQQQQLQQQAPSAAGSAGNQSPHAGVQAAGWSGGEGGALAAGHGASRVERIYSSKRSWVTQQLETSTNSMPMAAPLDSGVTGHTMCDRRPVVLWQRQRSSSDLPGAAAEPCGSDGAGYPGLFSAPTGCLAAASTGADGTAGMARDMHTCLHLCDSNRLAAGSKQQVQGSAAEQQWAVAGSKRKSTSSPERGRREPSSSAAGAAMSRCGSLASSQLLLAPSAAAAAVFVKSEAHAGALALGAQLAGQGVLPEPVAAAAVAAQAAAQPDAMATNASASEPTQQQQQQQEASCAGDDAGSKRQKQGGPADTCLAAPAVCPDVMAQPPLGTASSALGSVSAAAGKLPPIRLAPAPVDNAAAAVQMPPPAAHPRPHSATAAAAAAAGVAPMAAVAAAPAAAAEPAGGATAEGTMQGTAAADQQTPAAATSAAPGTAAVPVAPLGQGQTAAAVGPANLHAFNINLLLQQAQQQLHMQPALQQQQQLWQLVNAAQQLPLGGVGVGAGAGVGGVMPGAGLGLPLQGLAGLPAIAAQLPHLLAQQQQQQQLGLAGLWPAAPAALRPWGVPAVAAAVAASAGRPLGPGLLPPPVLAPFAAGLSHVPHPFVAAFNGAGAVLFGGAGAEGVGGHRVGGGGGTGGGRRHQAAEGSEQADSCLP